MNTETAKQTLKDNAEFIQGILLGNVPNKDNNSLITTLEAAKTLGIDVDYGTCTCTDEFLIMAKAIDFYCRDNNWFVNNEKIKSNGKK